MFACAIPHVCFEVKVEGSSKSFCFTLLWSPLRSGRHSFSCCQENAAMLFEWHSRAARKLAFVAFNWPRMLLNRCGSWFSYIFTHPHTTGTISTNFLNHQHSHGDSLNPKTIHLYTSTNLSLMYVCILISPFAAQIRTHSAHETSHSTEYTLYYVYCLCYAMRRYSHIYSVVSRSRFESETNYVGWFHLLVA